MEKKEALGILKCVITCFHCIYREDCKARGIYVPSAIGDDGNKPPCREALDVLMDEPKEECKHGKGCGNCAGWERRVTCIYVYRKCAECDADCICAGCENESRWKESK